MYRVVMQFGGKPVKKFTFDKQAVTIGRDAVCDITIDNIGASRHHATIEKTDDGYVLVDLESQNGTFVNGEKIFHHQLKDADEFFIGKYAFLFELLDPVVEVERDDIPEADPSAAADMTFSLDKKELDRILNQSSRGAASQLVQTKPPGSNAKIVLEKSYCLFGKVPYAQVKVGGFLWPPGLGVVVRTDHGYRLLSLSPKMTINGKFVPECPLSDGDLIQAGRLEFRFSQA